MEALNSRLAVARLVAERIGAVIRAHFRTSALVCEMRDRSHMPGIQSDARRAMQDEILASFPEDGVRASDGAHISGASGWNWWINTIDDPSAFVIGQLQWMTLIGLSHEGRLLAGLAYQPVLEEGFVGSPGRACWWRGPDLHHLETYCGRRLTEAVLAMPNVSAFRLAAEREAVMTLATQVVFVRDLGLGYACCLLASGLIDLAVAPQLGPHEIGPLIPIIEAAGGVVSDWSGKPCLEGGRMLAAADPRLHQQALQVLHWGDT